MPPKAELTKEKVLEAAFHLVREQGLEALSARTIAQKLRRSTQPIYSAYGSMEELKDDVFSRAVDFSISRMKQYEDDVNAPVMKLALGFLLFAQHDKQLFRTIFLSDYRKDYLTRNQDIFSEVMKTAFLQLDDRLKAAPERKIRQVHMKLFTYLLGVGTSINTGINQIEVHEAAEMLEELYSFLIAREGIY